MRKIYRITVAAVCALLLLATCACGNGIEGWPKDRFLKNVPALEVGVMSSSKIAEDGDGKTYALIKIAEFTVADMTNYIRALIDQGWGTLKSQTVVDNKVTYSARKGDNRIYLICDSEKNELTIQVE